MYDLLLKDGVPLCVCPERAKEERAGLSLVLSIVALTDTTCSFYGDPVSISGLPFITKFVLAYIFHAGKLPGGNSDFNPVISIVMKNR